MKYLEETVLRQDSELDPVDNADEYTRATAIVRFLNHTLSRNNIVSYWVQVDGDRDSRNIPEAKKNLKPGIDEYNGKVSSLTEQLNTVRKQGWPHREYKPLHLPQHS